MSRPRLVIVGNGMAATRTLEELLRLAPDRLDITVLGAEPHPAYNRVMLSPVLAGEQALADIELHPRAWYEAAGVRLVTGCRVDAIDRARRELRTGDGRTLPYDRLLLATGSVPFIPPVPGHDRPGVRGYRDIADTEAMIEAARTGGDAVVVGGGLLGLEAAWGLARRGLRVRVVHLGPHLMDRQLDAVAAAHLQAHLARHGISVLTQAHTEAFLGDGPDPAAPGPVRAVRLKDGRTLRADLVVVAAGIRPETSLARAAGLWVDRGIVVHDTLQSVTDPRIWAVGECAAHRGVTYGLVAPLYEQARVAATHLAGLGTGRYRGSRVSARLKVTGIEVFSAGEVDPGPQDETLTVHDPAAGVYRRLLLRDGRLVGACLYGDTDGAEDCLALLGAPLDARQRATLPFLPLGAPPPGRATPNLEMHA
jgi:nitrite reductase (NADH) large subunit